MNGIRGQCGLAWASLLAQPWHSLVLILVLVTLLLAPLLALSVKESWQAVMRQSLAQHPYIVGPPTAAVDSFLTVSFLRRAAADADLSILYEHVQSGVADVLPLHLQYQVNDAVLVGTHLDYFQHKRIGLQAGDFFTLLGDVVVGSAFAHTQRVVVGDTLTVDPNGVLDLTGGATASMHVVGILEPTGSPVDDQVFCDIQSCWLLDGLGHAHGEDQWSEAHFDLANKKLPISRAVLLPYDDTVVPLLRGRLRESQAAMDLWRSETTYQRLLQDIGLAESLLIGLYVIGLLLAALLFSLIVALHWQMRGQERVLYQSLGLGQWGIIRIYGLEYLLLITVAVVVTCILYFCCHLYFAHLLLNYAGGSLG